MGMIAFRPSTPVVAAARGSVPLYEVPVIPTFPFVQNASTVSSPSGVVYPLARPLSQSITAFGARDSFFPPTVGAPWGSPGPGDGEATTRKRRGRQVRRGQVDVICPS